MWPGAIRNVNKLQATSKTIVMFEAAIGDKNPKKGTRINMTRPRSQYVYADPEI